VLLRSSGGVCAARYGGASKQDRRQRGADVAAQQGRHVHEKEQRNGRRLLRAPVNEARRLHVQRGATSTETSFAGTRQWGPAEGSGAGSRPETGPAR